MPAASLTSAQALLQTTFDALARDGPAPIADLEAALTHPAERCLLQEMGVQSAGANLSSTQCADAVADVEAHASRSIVDQCWLRPPGASDSFRNANCTPTLANLAIHRGMLRRFPVAAHLLENDNHARLVDVLAHMPVVLAGDSLMRFAHQAAQCEVLRRSAAPGLAAVAAPRPPHHGGNKWSTTISAGASFALRQLQFVELTATDQGATVARQLSKLSASGGGVFVASIGMHYNQRAPNMRGAVEGWAILSRDEYRRDVTRLVQLLEQYATSTSSTHEGHDHGHHPHQQHQQQQRTHVALLLTPPLQHFETATGAYAHSIYSSVGYGCRAVNSSVLRGEPNASANVWRSAELLAAVREHGPHVLVAPWHALSNWLWDLHPGSAGTKRAERKGYVYKPTLDCTHLCYTPFVYEPLWWAIGVAASTTTSIVHAHHGGNHSTLSVM